VLAVFAPLFIAASSRAFTILACGFIAQTGRRTVCGDADRAGLSCGGFGDKGCQGTGLVTPKKKPKGGELTSSGKEYNSQISSFRALVEQLVAHFKNWKMLHADYRRPYSTYHEALGLRT
jgi:DDE superfamily endonuclease